MTKKPEALNWKHEKMQGGIGDFPCWDLKFTTWLNASPYIHLGFLSSEPPPVEDHWYWLQITRSSGGVAILPRGVGLFWSRRSSGCSLNLDDPSQQENKVRTLHQNGVKVVPHHTSNDVCTNEGSFICPSYLVFLQQTPLDWCGWTLEHQVTIKTETMKLECQMKAST